MLEGSNNAISDLMARARMTPVPGLTKYALLNILPGPCPDIVRQLQSPSRSGVHLAVGYPCCNRLGLDEILLGYNTYQLFARVMQLHVGCGK